MLPTRKLVFAVAAITIVVSLAGCATAPGSVEEQLWFDKVVGADIYDVPPDLRVRGAIGYPRSDLRFYPHGVPLVVEGR